MKKIVFLFIFVVLVGCNCGSNKYSHFATSKGCVKTIQVKTDTISNLEYIEPQPCKIREINKKNYKTTIQGNNIVISNEDMRAFLNNILDYKQAVKEYQQCVSLNEEYYKSVLNTILS